MAEDCVDCSQPATLHGESPDSFACHICARCSHFAHLGVEKVTKAIRQCLSLPGVIPLCRGCTEAGVGPATNSTSPGPAPSSASPAISERLDLLSAKVDSICSFLAPQPQSGSSKPRPASYASAAASSVPSSIQGVVQSAIAQHDAELDHAKSVIIAGLEQEEGEDLLSKVNDIFHTTGVGDQVRVHSAKRLPSRPAPDGKPRPALVKVQTGSPDMASALISASVNLRKTPSTSKIFIRPSRTREERRLLSLRCARRDQLNKDAEAGITHFVSHKSAGFPLIRVNKDKPDWKWEDEGWDAFVAAHQVADTHSARRSLPRPANQGNFLF